MAIKASVVQICIIYSIISPLMDKRLLPDFTTTSNAVIGTLTKNSQGVIHDVYAPSQGRVSRVGRLG